MLLSGHTVRVEGGDSWRFIPCPNMVTVEFKYATSPNNVIYSKIDIAISFRRIGILIPVFLTGGLR